MQYVVVNLGASLLFLVGVSLIYGVTGTLNMADLAIRIAEVRDTRPHLLEAGAGILAIAFLIKAGMWPLCFWLPTTYAAASPPVACVFAILTKVGAYVVLRLWLLLFGNDIGTPAQFGGEWLFIGGLATIAFGVIGTLAAQDMARLAAFSVLVSAGTLLAAIGMGQIGVTSGALYYLISSTLGIAAFFLLVELVERGREPGADMLAVTREVYGEDDPTEDDKEEAGIAIPATMGMLGLAFVACALLVAGLPPFPAFIAKFALLSAALGTTVAPAGAPSSASWALMVMLIVPGLAAMIAMARAGVTAFWAEPDRVVPRVRLIEMAPIAVLILLCGIQTIAARSDHAFQAATAQSLHAPQGYVRAVLGAATRAFFAFEGGDMSRLFRFPLATGGLLALWLVLNQSLSMGQVVLGVAIAVVGAWTLGALRVPEQRARRLASILRLAGLVLADIVRSNIAVARIVLGGRRGMTSGFVRIPIDLKNFIGLATLACIITATPGTLWVAFDEKREC